jgi:hypothetical protein
MGNTCCNYTPKDPNLLTVGGTKTEKMGASAKLSVQELTPQLKEALVYAK